jgi:starch synthase
MYGDETRIPELLGQTLLEGMACGIPTICTDVASMPEIVEDRVSGFVVPPNNPAALGQAVQWLVDHPAEAIEMGRAAHARVLEKFTWPTVVERCLDAYESALRRRSRRHFGAVRDLKRANGHRDAET